MGGTGGPPYEPGADAPTDEPGAGVPTDEPGADGPPAVGPHIYGTAAGPPETAGPPRRRWWRIVALAFVVAGLAVLVGGYVWVNSEANPSGPAGPQVIVTVAPGAAVGQLASTLAGRQVIGSSLAYRIWSQLHHPPSLQAGAYAFRRNSSFSTVDNVIAAGPNVFPIDIPPGFTVAEVAGRVGQLPGHSKADFLAAPSTPPGSRPARPAWRGCSAPAST